MRDYSFIVRKHTTQKGVFIVNFYWREILCVIYIRNKDNIFWLEQHPDINAIELQFISYLMIENAETLNDIVSRIEYILNPNKTENIGWEQQRQELLDAEINSSSSYQPNLFQFGLDTIKDVLPSTDRFMNAIQFWK